MTGPGTVTGPATIPVFVVLQPRVLLLDVAGPVEVLRRANHEQDHIRFDVRFVGPGAEVLSSIGLPLAAIPPLPERLPDGALLLMPGSTQQPLGAPVDPPAGDAALDDAIVAWLRSVVRPGIRLICVCSGSLLAGRAGLFDGRDCTTHHRCIDQLRALAPRARVLENRLFVDDGDRLSSAGVTAGLDLMLHVIAGLVGPMVTLAVARYLVIYLRRSGGDPQLSPWLEGRNHVHPVIHRVQDAITADPGRDWNLNALARLAGASSRHLSRLFNDHAGMSVTDYVSRTRVARAHQLLVGTRTDMETVAEQAGFGSTRQFRRAWNRLHDQPPSRLRRRDGGVDGIG